MSKVLRVSADLVADLLFGEESDIKILSMCVERLTDPNLEGDFSDIFIEVEGRDVPNSMGISCVCLNGQRKRIKLLPDKMGISMESLIEARENAKPVGHKLHMPNGGL